MDFKGFYKELIFDVDRPLLQTFAAKQSDTKSRGFYVTVIQNSVIIPIVNQTMTFYAEKPDKTRVFIDAVKDNDRFRVDLTNQVFAVIGKVKCELMLKGDNGELISNKMFVIEVDRTLQAGSIISEDELSDLAQLRVDFNEHKDNYARLMDFKLRNNIFNGNFTVDSDGDGLADNWTFLNKSDIASFHVENEIQYWTPNISTANGSIQQNASYKVALGDICYLDVTCKNIASIRHTGIANQTIINVLEDGRLNLIFESSVDQNYILRFIPKLANVESCIANVHLINLTEFFYQPVLSVLTTNVMAKLIDILPGGYLDGTLSISQKQLINWLVILISEGTLGQVAGGGSSV